MAAAPGRRARPRPRRVRGPVRPPADARPARRASAPRGRPRRDRDRVRRAARRARRARSRRLRRVPRPDLGAARAQGPRALPRRGRRARRARAGGGRRGARTAARRVPPREGGAAWLAERLDASRDRFFRLGPAPLAPARPAPAFAPQPPSRLADAIRALAVEPPAPSTAHMALAFPPVAQFLERWRSLLQRRSRARLRPGGRPGLSRVEVAVAFLALLELAKQRELAFAQAAPFAPIRISRPVRRKEPPVDRPLRLVASQPGRGARPHDRGAARRRRRRRSPRRSSPTRPATTSRASPTRSSCSPSATARAAAASCSSTSPAASPSAPRARRPRRAPACSSGPSSAGSRRRRSRRSRSSPTSARARAPTSPGSAASTPTPPSPASSSAACVAESGRDAEFGAVRYATTPLFERVFGLESLAELPRLDDVGADAGEIRERLEAVAEKRPA